MSKKIVWRLGEILLQNGWVKWEHLTKALEIQEQLQHEASDDMARVQFLKSNNHNVLSLGELLVLNGFISWDQLEKILVLQKSTGELLGNLCLKQGVIKEEQLYRALAQQAGLPFVDLKNITIPSHLIKLVPMEFALEHHLMPIAQKRNEIIIALNDMHNVTHEIEFKKRFPNLNIFIVVAARKDISETIEKYYGKKEPATA